MAAGAEYDELDPLLVAAIEDHFAAVDPISLLADALNGADPEAGVLAYEAFLGESVEGEL
ncbi:hypothetical protein [Streptomyces showdoensis]|uniref:Uncharacterized protein n=1 Tax=Streptomyces showdoensis TaxID=68268 RepID=A0A2P2GMJ9_STREW|nr:hypothetical protein [Streptomyces showdoensis]KKZ72045.1 hypothetical protein VO63_19845 [Streptomyces showdoensis]